ncbi:MAG: diaminopimelate epimerase [Isosphaerales bacterium]
MRFTKMHGIGNDYVYVATFDQGPPADPAGLAREVSDRHYGIGGDGLILIMPSERADARMRMFNADGSEGEMCGNGIRCVAKYIYDHGLARKDQVTIETGRGVLSLDLDVREGQVQRVRVAMGAPIFDPAQIPTLLPGEPPIEAPIRVGDRELAVTAVSMGNPHAVTYVADVAAFPLELLGPLIERHSAFPRRANVHVVEIVGKGEVRMRTWERGSGITLACGTGACAVCVAGVLTGRSERTILAHLPGGDLELTWPDDRAPVFMTGPAAEVFSGEWTDTSGKHEG